MKQKIKLYSLVRVSMDSDRYSIIGQVLSLPTPDSTVMVRMVPDRPGTLAEVPLARVQTIAGSRYDRVSYATVSGMGQFPEDMLRYDRAVPVNFKVESTEHGPRAVIDRLHGSSEFIVAKVMERGSRIDFTDARWSSFLWNVKRIRQERLEVPS